MHKIPTVIQSFLCIILDLQLHHKHKHKHNINGHNTPIFTWFTTNEVATSTGTLSLLYLVKEVTKFLLRTSSRSLSLFSSLQNLCAQNSQSALSLFSSTNTLAYKICRTKGEA